jgi:hypothetical protein
VRTHCASFSYLSDELLFRFLSGGWEKGDGLAKSSLLLFLEDCRTKFARPNSALKFSHIFADAKSKDRASTFGSQKSWLSWIWLDVGSSSSRYFVDVLEIVFRGFLVRTVGDRRLKVVADMFQIFGIV